MAIDTDLQGHESGGDYLEALRRFQDPLTEFHPVAYGLEMIETVEARRGLVRVDGVPVFVVTDKAPEIVEPNRCREIVKRALGDEAAERPILFSIVPGLYIEEKLPDIKRALEMQGIENSAIIAEYNASVVSEAAPPFQSISNIINVSEILHPVLGTTAGLSLQQTLHHMDTDGSRAPASLTEVVSSGLVQGEASTEHGAVIKTKVGGQLNDEELAQLWELFRQRFNDISDNLPVRLEENEEATRELLNDSRFVFTYQVEQGGKIFCCVFGTDVTEAYPWIGVDYLDALNRQIEDEEGEKVYSVFVPGVASYGVQGKNASYGVLDGFSEVVGLTNHVLTAVRFECTDVSSIYIPRTVDTILGLRSEFDPSAQTTELARKKYALISFPK